jgi:hypothetical protein
MKKNPAKKIPTRLIGEITSEIIDGRRVNIYHTNVGPMTGKQIQIATGIPPHTVLERYREKGVGCKDIFSVGDGRAEEVEKMGIPTMILHYRTMKMVAEGKSGFRMCQCYLTDAGWLSIYEMWKKTKVNVQTIATRIHRFEPGHKDIFAPNLSATPKHSGNSKMNSLGGRSRADRLSNFKIGTWEEANLR